MGNAPDYALDYEHFIRDAFRLEAHKDVEKQEDPARLADKDLWHDENMYQIKIALGYAVLTYYWYLRHKAQKQLADPNHEKRDAWIEALWSAKDLDELKTLIEDVKKVNHEHMS